jgi:aminoglycoside 2'-N-acetyltransferase I
MPQTLIYPSPELPPRIKCQLLAYVRVEWWWVFQGANRFWDYTVKDTHPVNVVIVENEVLLSHAEVNWRTLEHHGESYKVYGVSAVYTAPPFRKEGLGKQVVEAATHYIQSSDADVAMLFCLPALTKFYGSCGWTHMTQTEILAGEKDSPYVDKVEQLMMLFISGKGKAKQSLFENTGVYMGNHTW